MQKIKQTWNMLSYNFKTLIEFQLIFKIISLIIFTPLFIKHYILFIKSSNFNSTFNTNTSYNGILNV